MDKKRKIKCALESIAKTAEERKSFSRPDDKGLQWAAELLKDSLDAGNKTCRYCGQRRAPH